MRLIENELLETEIKSNFCVICSKMKCIWLILKGKKCKQK